jgi:hypothetical protein
MEWVNVSCLGKNIWIKLVNSEANLVEWFVFVIYAVKLGLKG